MRRLLVVLGLMCVMLPALCSESEQLDSIHFNSRGLDFGIVPRRGIVWYEHTDRPADGEFYNNGFNSEAIYELSFEADEAREKTRAKLRARSFHAASVAERRGDWSGAIRAYIQMVGRLGWTGGVRDRVQVLERGASMGRDGARPLLPALRRYLAGMAKLEAGRSADAERLFQAVYDDRASGFLREHALYQLASTKYQAGDNVGAANVYGRVISEFAKGAKEEDALIMLARCYVFTARTPADAAPGVDALRSLLRRFPRTHFRSKAQGMLARVQMLAGHLREASWRYLQLGDLESAVAVRKEMTGADASWLRLQLYQAFLHRLVGARSHYRYSHAVYELGRLTKMLTSSDAFKLSQRLLADPNTASAYLYYRLYHCRNTPAQYAALGILGAKLATRYGRDRLAPEVRVRLAELFYRRAQYARALEWSRVGEDKRGRVAERAAFVQGASLHKMGRRGGALAAFRLLLRQYPESSLRHGVHEELALLYEEGGDLSHALDEYMVLGYDGDIAFLMDARMSTRELERYYATRSAESKLWTLKPYYNWDKLGRYPVRHLLAYTIGLRHLREERWAVAARWLRRVPRDVYAEFSKGRKEWGSRPSPDPLTAAREMRNLQLGAVRATDPNRRADALYAYASYYYKHGTLLLYNPALWQDQRMIDFDEYWNQKHATTADEIATREHMYAVDVYARCLRLCKEIARKYPRSPAAPRALYRAACSAYYLSDFNEWWRTGHERLGQDNRGKELQAEAATLMQRLANRYPHHALAASARKYGAVFAVTGLRG